MRFPDARDDLVLLAAEPLELGLFLHEMDEELADERRDSAVSLCGADAGAVVQVRFDRYSDIFHSFTVSLFHSRVNPFGAPTDPASVRRHVHRGLRPDTPHTPPPIPDPPPSAAPTTHADAADTRCADTSRTRPPCQARIAPRTRRSRSSTWTCEKSEVPASPYPTVTSGPAPNSGRHLARRRIPCTSPRSHAGAASRTSRTAARTATPRGATRDWDRPRPPP